MGLICFFLSDELPSEAHTTAMFLEAFDQLFDAVNADSPDLRRGKKFSTNLTAKSPHLELFKDMKTFISSMKYLGGRSNPPSKEGWIHTMNAIDKLWGNIQKLGILSLSTRRLNQDPLENLFGCIRYNCGSNCNPTVQQFIGGIKTSIITNLRHTGKNKNCEDDTATLANNMSSFLNADVLPEQSFSEITTDVYFDINKLLAESTEAVDQATSEGQACGYVCGFIYKRLKHNNCLDCKKTFLAESQELVHTFTSFKEYNLNKNSLNYVNKHVIQCVETMSSIIYSSLKLNDFQSPLKKHIFSALECIDFSFLNNCMTHYEANVLHLKTCTFFICKKRYIVLENRITEEDERKRAMERRLSILRS